MERLVWRSRPFYGAPYARLWKDVNLPSAITPVHYNITLQPDMGTFHVNGTSTIEANVNEGTDYILLHAKSMSVVSFSVNNYTIKRFFIMRKMTSL